MTKKLIDADALKIAIGNGEYCKYCEEGKLYGCRDCDRCSFKDDLIEQLIDAQPEVKPEPVVRCKDCKFASRLGKLMWCNLHGALEDANGYCYRGENGR